jgi:hypothetical protein
LSGLEKTSGRTSLLFFHEVAWDLLAHHAALEVAFSGCRTIMLWNELKKELL